MTVVASVIDLDQRMLSRRERADRERFEMRTRILECARHIVREGTMFDLTMQRLASDAGVSRQTIYRYFPAVQDVFRALSDEVITQIYSNLPDLPLDDPNYMAEFVQVAVNVFCADSQVVRVLVLTSAIGRASGDWVQVDPEQVLLSALTAMPAAHRPVSRDPKVAARVLITYFRGALYGWAAGFLNDSEFEQEVRKAGRLAVT
ncbi:MAG: TetR/AcrR family transcriptional regulator [Ilumatobacteraceae bacterium]